MTQLFTTFGIDPARLVKGVFEANLLLLFVICLIHSLKVNGRQRTIREFVAGFVLTALAESTGVLSGAYVYPGFQFYILATPVGNPASWVALVYVIMTVSDRLVFGRQALDDYGKPLASPRLIPGKSLTATLLLLALCDAVLALSIDLVLDPLATIYNWWIWVPCEEGVRSIAPGVVDAYNFDHKVWMSTPASAVGDFFGGFFEEGWRYPTRLLGIPLINFIAWLVFVFVFTLEFRWIESRRHWSEWRRTLVLWLIVLADVPPLALLLIAPNI